MKQTITLVIGLLLVAAVPTAAETAREVYTDHYRVLSHVGHEHAAEVASRLEALIQLYNRYFRFELGTLARPMLVRIFADKAQFDRYLVDTIGEQRDDFVYLHYSDPARSELVAYDMPAPDFDYALTHQNFIQYLRTFIPNPPLWLREGFAVYFEQAEYDDEFHTVIYRENLAWLDPLKEILDGSAGVTPLDLDEILVMDVETARANLELFYPQAWGMVSFLVNSERRDINRLLWDSINALRPEASLRQNTERVYQRAFSWIDKDDLVDAFVAYIDSRRSFSTLVTDGIEAYDRGDYDTAEELLVSATAIDGRNHIPFYYLGLINFERGNHPVAEAYYRQAMERGATESLTYYAMGVNAYAANRRTEATEFLQRSASMEPERFGDRVEQLLQRMDG
ncbi:MAG: hypothetical protein EA404_13345 [Spirochaetaceae bacterium]|nr:MAG: hypothetical protein EA404_13345 [Spirochaetaceae bacterium]